MTDNTEKDQTLKRIYSSDKGPERSSQQILTTGELLNCQINDSTWKCPVKCCLKQLSRKQTLQSHVISQHGISFEESPKRYKLYETDESMSVPRSTTSYWKSKNGNKLETITGNSILVESGGDGDIPGVEGYNTEMLRNSKMPSTSCDFNTSPETEQHFPLNFDLPPVLLDHSDEGTDMSISGDSSESAISTDEEYCSDSEAQYNIDRNNSEQSKVNSSAPVYVLQPNKTVYVSPLTQQEHILAVTAFSTHENLSDTGVKNLLSLIQLHLPERNIGEQKVQRLKKACGFDEDYLKFHMFCNTCNKLFLREDSCPTPGCCIGGGTQAKQSYFVTGDVKKLMTEILERDGIWEAIQETHSCVLRASLSDITSGLEYQKLRKPGGFLHCKNNLTLTMFTDGIPLFKSSCVSLWPVYLLINEIPPSQRFSRKNMLLWGLWQGVSKPKMNMFLRPLIIDLLELYHKGIFISKTKLPIKAMLLVATMDLPARAGVLQMTQHNGQYGCVYCMEPGEVVKSGKGTCRSYPYKNPPLLPAPLRLHSEIKQSAEISQRDGVRHLGFLGKSVLIYLPYFSFPKNVVIDYMHGILLGITKKLLSLWLEPERCKENYFIGDKIKDLDKILKKCSAPVHGAQTSKKAKGKLPPMEGIRTEKLAAVLFITMSKRYTS